MNVPKVRWEECPDCQARIKAEGLADEHELQSYFIRRIEKFLLSKDRKLIGWDEILKGGLAPEATVMSWRGTEGGIAAARQGHDVIVTPMPICTSTTTSVSLRVNRLQSEGILPCRRFMNMSLFPKY
ncbi:MAG: family 20 glycosylhydrolase [Bacteroidales bacterium]